MMPKVKPQRGRRQEAYKDDAAPNNNGESSSYLVYDDYGESLVLCDVTVRPRCKFEMFFFLGPLLTTHDRMDTRIKRVSVVV